MPPKGQRANLSARGRHIAQLIGSYDLRARFPQDLNADDGELLGESLALLCGQRVLMGRDTRAESRKFQSSLVSGLHAAGCETFDMGILPTPVIAYGCRLWGTTGLMVTPSHNPVGEVGLKGFSSTGEIWGNEWDLLRKRLRRGLLSGTTKPTPLPPDAKIPPTAIGLKKSYLGNFGRFQKSHLRVAVDPRGGATVGWASAALRAVGASVFTVNDRHSANFFGESPEPTHSNIETLSRTWSR